MISEACTGRDEICLILKIVGSSGLPTAVAAGRGRRESPSALQCGAKIDGV